MNLNFVWIGKSLIESIFVNVRGFYLCMKTSNRRGASMRVHIYTTIYMYISLLLLKMMTFMPGSKLTCYAVPCVDMYLASFQRIYISSTYTYMNIYIYKHIHHLYLHRIHVQQIYSQQVYMCIYIYTNIYTYIYIYIYQNLRPRFARP